MINKIYVIIKIINLDYITKKAKSKENSIYKIKF